MLMAREAPTVEEGPASLKDAQHLLVCPASLKDPAPLCAVQAVQVGWPQPSQPQTVPIRLLLGGTLLQELGM